MQHRPGSEAIPDDNIVTSSGTGKARLNEDVWIPANNDTYPTITIQFDTVVSIAALHVRWVTD